MAPGTTNRNRSDERTESSRGADEGGAVSASRDHLPRSANRRTFLISCGGTGGHLAPGIALAEELRGRGHDVTLLISEKKVDTQMAAKYPELRFRPVPGAPFSLRPAAAWRCAYQQARGWRVAWQLVRQHQPAAIIGFGGFTSAAVVLVGAWLRVPIVLHESNRVPGRAIRGLGRLARRVYLPRGVTLPGLPPDRVQAVGMPVRQEIQPESRADACAHWGLDPARPVVAVLGGSQGARPLNEWARTAAAELTGTGMQLLVVTGPDQAGATAALTPAADGAGRAVWLPFCDRMATLLSAADLVVSRSGAGTLAELVRCRTPAILVPYPFAADNHQAANAAEFAGGGGGIVWPQENLSRLTAEVLRWVREPEELQQRRAALAACERGDPRQVMADDLEALGRPPRSESFPAGRPAAA
jgi:UDP-N-acetylglucosamine--N-acetylmuramyl-(pentapeptide) pyrophosphoryl-undecaprenol N-acetylglucosamine transferase